MADSENLVSGKELGNLFPRMYASVHRTGR